MTPSSLLIPKSAAAAAAAAARPLHPSPKQCPAALRRVCLLAVAVVFALAAFPIRSGAQARPSAENAKGVQILMLGTKGGPPLTLDRSEPSTLLIVDGRRYLIDCGIGTMRRLVRAGIPSGTIRTIFFTHLHPDHALGLIDVMGNDFYTLNSAGRADTTIGIYGPPETKELVSDAVNFLNIPFDIFKADGLTYSNPADMFKAHNIDSAGLVFQDDKIRVTAVENTHYVLMPAKYHARMKSYAYRIETPYGVIVFTGDTGPSDAVTRLAKGANVLVSEVIDLGAMTRFVDGLAARSHWTQKRTVAFLDHMKYEHMPMKNLGEMATKAHVKAVLLHHLVPVENPAIFRSGVKKYFSGPVFVGADLARYCLGAPGASGTAAHTLHPCP